MALALRMARTSEELLFSLLSSTFGWTEGVRRDDMD